MGFFVAGLNRYRAFDEGYRGFIELVAGQITAGLTNARAYEEERLRNERLLELDEAKTAFFTNVSHELRTPLTLLLGPAEDALADDTASLQGEQRIRVERIHRNAQRLLKLVNTLLDFSRLQSGRVNAAYTPTDLGRYTAELVSMFESATDRAGLDLVIDTPPLPDPVYVDAEMWAKIVMNLVSNALKFTFTGGITVRLYATDHDVELSVIDTGIGIDPADQERLFERFHRVIGAQSRSHEGTGVGPGARGRAGRAPRRLRGRAVHARGRFDVHGHDPVRRRASTRRPGRQRPGRADRAALRRRLRRRGDALAGPRDERPRTRPRPRASARACSSSTTTPTCGPTSPRCSTPATRCRPRPTALVALELARRDPPELVVTDVMMPNLDGFGLLAGLQADPATTDIPVIMVSARAGEEGTIEGLEAGADDYLIKPFAARELLARVHANIELDRARRTRDALRRSGDLLDQAQRLARVGSWEIDLATNEMTASAEYLRQVGLTAEELRAGGLDPCLPARAPRRRRARVPRRSGRRSRVGGWRSSSGSSRPTRARASSMPSASSNATRTARPSACAAACRTSRSSVRPSRRWRPRTPSARPPRGSAGSPTSCSAASCRSARSTSSSSRSAPTTGPAWRARRSAATGTT